MNLRFCSAAVLAALLLPAAAQAQASPAPVGSWSTDDGSEELVITASGTCQFVGHTPQGDSLTIGSCSWNAGSAGGILTIMNTNQYQPAPVYFNIVWVDQNTIRVYGDVMHRRAG
jgi:hypothetical protein